MSRITIEDYNVGDIEISSKDGALEFEYCDGCVNWTVEASQHEVDIEIELGEILEQADLEEVLSEIGEDAISLYLAQHVDIPHLFEIMAKAIEHKKEAEDIRNHSLNRNVLKEQEATIAELEAKIDELKGISDLGAEANEPDKEEFTVTDEELEAFTYLDELRESGETNMFGAAPYLQSELGWSKREAETLTSRWMKEFSQWEEYKQARELATAEETLAAKTAG